MIAKAAYIFFINLITYGGGGVYIPVYESYYTDMYHLMSQHDYYNVVSIVNIIPGVTGGKLAGYAMFLDYGILGMILAIILFAGSGIMLVLLLDKVLEKVNDHPIFIEINNNIKPVVAGILLTITYNFYQLSFEKMAFFYIAVISIITGYLLIIRKVKIYYLVVGFFILGLLVATF